MLIEVSIGAGKVKGLMCRESLIYLPGSDRCNSAGFMAARMSFDLEKFYCWVKIFGSVQFSSVQFSSVS